VFAPQLPRSALRATTSSDARMLSVLLLAVLASTPAFAGPPKPDELPAALRDWERWVLHDEKDRNCPFLQGNGERRCAWPGQLTLTLDE